MAERAITSVCDIVFETPSSGLKPHRMQAHIVVLVPDIQNQASMQAPFWPKGAIIEPALLHEASYGNPQKFPYPFKEIARSKALQLWQGQNIEQTDIMPHLLMGGDTPFWGGVKRGGIVVACSGVKPWLDKMISGMVAEMLIGMAYQAWMDSPDRADGELCFIR